MILSDAGAGLSLDKKEKEALAYKIAKKINLLKKAHGSELYVFLSHKDGDHTVLLKSLMNNEIKPAQIYYGGTYNSYQGQTKRYLPKIRPNKDGLTTLPFPATKVHFYTPTGKGNDSSLILNIVYNDASVVIPGDTTQKITNQIVENHRDLFAADIFFADHHGGETHHSNEYPWLIQVCPMCILFSCGIDNQHKHPKAKVVGRMIHACKELASANQHNLTVECSKQGKMEKALFSTADHGNIQITFVKKGHWTIKSF